MTIKEILSYNRFAVVLIMFFLPPPNVYAHLELAFHISHFEGAYNLGCNGATDGTNEAIAFGANKPFFYTWSNSATTSLLQNLSSGVYTVTVTDFSNATETKTVELFQPNSMVVHLHADEFEGRTNLSEKGVSIENISNPITHTNDARQSSISNVSTYAPFLNNSKWLNSDTYGGHGYVNDLFQYVKDTLYSGNVYQMFSDYGIYIPGIYNDPNISAGYKGFKLFREDTIAKKVYIPLFPNSEKLLYDFSLNIGDTLPVNSGIIGTYYLTLIDSVLTQVGFRKRFTFTLNLSPFRTVVWIEGVGNISSTTQNYYSTASQSSVVCNYQNDTVVIDQSTFLYPPNQFNCAGIYAGINDVLNNVFEKIDVFPSPFKNELTISATLYRPQKISIKLYDILGNLLSIIAKSDKEVVGKVEYKYHSEELKEGVYLCVMESNYGKVIKKIIKIN